MKYLFSKPGLVWKWLEGKGYTGTAEDAWTRYVTQGSPLTSGTIHDHLVARLTLAGYGGGTLQDMLNRMFTAKTGIGHRADAERAFFQDSSLEMFVEGNEVIDSYTKLFYTFNGTNGGTSTLDSIANVAMTLSGGATITNVSPLYGTYAGDFDGSATSRADIAANASQIMGSSPWTISCWVSFDDASSRQFIWARTDSAGNLMCWFEFDTNTVKFGISGVGTVTYPFYITTGQYYHFEVGYTGSSGAVYIFVDGVLAANSTLGTGFSDTSTYKFTLGMQPLATQNLNGRIDNFKYDLGTVRHTADFAPPGRADYAHTALLSYDFSSSLPSDVTFSRSSHATMINSDGNLVWADSNMITQSSISGAVVGSIGSGGAVPTGWSWTSGSGLTREVVEIGSDYIICRLSGTVTGGSTVYPHLRFQAPITTAALGQSYTLSAYVQIISGGLTNFSVGSGKLVMQWLNSGTYVSEAQGSTTMSSDLTRMTATGTMPSSSVNQMNPQLNFIATDGAVINITFKIYNPQVEPTSIDSPRTYKETTGTAYYGPRVDYNPNTLSSNGILIEEQRTNLVVVSTPITGWVASGYSSIAQSPATMLGQVCARITFDNASSGHFYAAGAITLTGSTRYTVSAYVEEISGNNLIQLTCSANAFATDCYANFNISSGTVTASGAGASNASIQDCGNGVFRISASFVTIVSPLAGSSPIVAAINSGTDTRIPTFVYNGIIDVFGFQVEAGYCVTSLIPTTSVSATRSADNYTDDITGVDKGTAGYWKVVAGPVGYGTGGGSSMSIVQFDDTSANNRLCMRADSSNGTKISTVVVGGVTGMNVAFGSSGFTTSDKLSQSWDTANIKFSRNASIIQSSSAHGGLPTTTRIVFGGGASVTGSARINGWIQSVAYYKTPIILTDTLINSVTT